MHKKARKQFAEDKKTKDMDYWNHVLWSDETKINLFGSDGVKRVAARAALTIGLGGVEASRGPVIGCGVDWLERRSPKQPRPPPPTY